MRFRVYTNSLGNYYLEEIKRLVIAGLIPNFTVENCTERDGFGADDVWHVFVAPHEFFMLGRGVELGKRSLPNRSIFLTTEQPGSTWFELALSKGKKASVIWDIDFVTAQKISEVHPNVSHLSLKYQEGYIDFLPVPKLPGQSQYYLGDLVQKSPSYLDGVFQDRPIDIFFIGGTTPRRNEILAQLSPFLSGLEHCIILMDNSKPIRGGINTSIGSQLICGLEQRAKIILNLHREEDSYFESHRMIYHGAAQGALVLSEPCTAQSPSEELPFIYVPWQQMGEKIQYLICDKNGRDEARLLAKDQYERFIANGSLSDKLHELTSKLPMI